MGNESRKKLDISNKDFEFGYVRKPSWEGYDILKIMDDRIVAKRKDNGLITVFFPVVLWQLAGID